MNDQLTELTRAQNAGHAHIIRGLLESNDIACFLFDEGMNVMLGQGGAFQTGIRVMVREADLEAARALISNTSE